MCFCGALAMCKTEGGFSLAVCVWGSPAEYRGFADTPGEMQLGGMIFVMCTHMHSICLLQHGHGCGVSHGHPFLPTWDPSAVSPRACTCVNQHLSAVSIALYLPASVYLHAGLCVSHNRYSESLIWWVKWSGLFDQPSGSITTRASAGAGITTYI